MRKSNFVKFINSLSEEELREELDRLYTKYKPVKEYYTMELGGVEDRKKLLDKAKNGISKLYERRKTRSRLSKVNTILKDISMISIFDHELADVYLHHAEQAAAHINYYGLARDADANHLIKSFHKAVDLVTSSQTRVENEERLDTVIENLHYFRSIVRDLSNYIDENLI